MPEENERRPLYSAPGAWLAWIREFLANLFDLEFSRLLTPRMMPVIYAFAIVATALAVLAYAASGFILSLQAGLLRLLLIGPLAFLAMITLVRVALEFTLVVFRIAVHVNKMAGHTGEIAGGLPRIQFWKPFLRKTDADDDA